MDIIVDNLTRWHENNIWCLRKNNAKHECLQ
jgi:hypothetical protein